MGLSKKSITIIVIVLLVAVAAAAFIWQKDVILDNHSTDSSAKNVPKLTGQEHEQQATEKRAKDPAAAQDEFKAAADAYRAEGNEPKASESDDAAASASRDVENSKTNHPSDAVIGPMPSDQSAPSSGPRP